ncbi:MAG TPA: DUF3307 domain-containing protein [Chitinophagaceae bacterium]|nr:DUF3307 domain-containing protein [Chitinophagaceae bacterium]
MNIPATWLAKLILSHLLTDFLLQPGSWVRHRRKKHFASAYLYLHGVLTGVIAWAFLGLKFWWVAAIITATHILIDGWKSCRPDKPLYFLLDQALHIIVILICWHLNFFTFADLRDAWAFTNQQTSFWITGAAFISLTFPAGILIGQLTQRWRDQLKDPERPEQAEGLANAGKWIGILERSIIFVLLMQNQYEAIGLLIAAKSILRFNESDRQEEKTEYVVIGSLISIGLVIMTGIFVKFVLAHWALG